MPHSSSKRKLRTNHLNLISTGQDPENQVVMTPRAVAKLLNVSQRKLERDRQEGNGIPFVKFGRRVLYRGEDVLNYLEQNRFESTAASKLAGGRR